MDKANFFLEKPVFNANVGHNQYHVGLNDKNDAEFYHFRRSDTILTIYNLSKNTVRKTKLDKAAKIFSTDRGENNLLYVGYIHDQQWIGIGSFDAVSPKGNSLVYCDFEGNPVFSVKVQLSGYEDGHLISPVHMNKLYDSTLLIRYEPRAEPLEKRYDPSALWVYDLRTRQLDKQGFVKHPESYHKGKDFFDLGTLNVSVVKDFLVVSFWFNDSLFVYKGIAKKV